MAKENKRPAAESVPLAQPRAPGRVRPGGHGPQTGPMTATQGVDHLRACMAVSADVGIETVCEEAALEIERLRGK